MRKTIISAVCACITFTSSIVNAALYERDLFAQGDGLLMYDSSTGLEWLDLGYCSGGGISIEPCGLPDGFELASHTEVGTMLINAGADSFYPQTMTSNTYQAIQGDVLPLGQAVHG